MLHVVELPGPKVAFVELKLDLILLFSTIDTTEERGSPGYSCISHT